MLAEEGTACPVTFLQKHFPESTELKAINPQLRLASRRSEAKADQLSTVL
jgi:hypothetical protein